MKNISKVLLAAFLTAIFLTVTVSAKESIGIMPDDIPKDIIEYIPQEAFNTSAEDFIKSFSVNNALKTVLDILQKVFPDAASAFFGFLGLLIISAVLGALREAVASESFGTFLEFVSVLCISAAAFSFTEELFEEFEVFVSEINAFMAVIIPAITALMVSCGNITSSAVFGGVLSGMVTALEIVCVSAVLPMLRAWLCVSSVSRVCYGEGLPRFSRLLKNILTYTLTTLTAVMSCVLAFQGVIAKSADTAAVKGVKFVLGNIVPVVGGALSDAVGTVASSLSIVKSATGILGAVVLCIIFAMPVIKLVIWKLVFDAASAAAAAFSLKKESEFLDDIAGAVGFMTAIMASISVFFIIAVTIAAG